MADAETPVETANRLIAYHAPISRALTQERTSLESALIPVTAYIVVACAESYLRYPEMMERIDAAMPAEEIGRRARRPGCQVDPCYLWSIANFFLLGRKIMAMVDPQGDDPARTATVLDFWERAALAYRGDGTRQAWDTGTSRIYDDATVAALLDGAVPIADDEHRAAVKRFNATLVNHLFLLYFDTRAGYGDTGPYAVPGAPGQLAARPRLLPPGPRRLPVVRRRHVTCRTTTSPPPWCSTTCRAPSPTSARRTTRPRTTSTASSPSASTPPTGSHRASCAPVPADEHDGIVAAVRKAQAQHYRNIAAMDRDEKIRAGAYVYFSFLRPFAEIAGVADELDWSVPRDLPEPLYQLMSAMQGENAGDPGGRGVLRPLPGGVTDEPAPAAP